MAGMFRAGRTHHRGHRERKKERKKGRKKERRKERRIDGVSRRKNGVLGG
jgi:hypothetical protein